MIAVGYIIAHSDAINNKWIARVYDINENDLYVVITSDHGGEWSETWNLEHTQAGLRKGEYYIVGRTKDEQNN